MPNLQLSIYHNGRYEYWCDLENENTQRTAAQIKRRIAIMKIPKQHHTTLQKIYTGRRAPFGEIAYSITGKHAENETYFPKGRDAKGFAKGLAAHIEKICVAHLKTQGIQTISTSQKPSEDRTKQLARLGLESHKTYPIDEWLAALKKATKKRTTS
ncbi:MAG: hypothetical protein V1722_02835 [Candidatus Micrarchaeota archaeon]